jgi:hypothetical protein
MIRSLRLQDSRHFAAFPQLMMADPGELFLAKATPKKYGA